MNYKERCTNNLFSINPETNVDLKASSKKQLYIDKLATTSVAQLI